MDSNSSSASEEGVFSIYGLQRALNADVRLPTSPVDPTKETKDGKCREYVNDRHGVLVAAFDKATKAFDVISEQRDNHDDAADPQETDKMNRKYFEASSKLAKAEMEYNVFKADIDELCNRPKASIS